MLRGIIQPFVKIQKIKIPIRTCVKFNQINESLDNEETIKSETSATATTKAGSFNTFLNQYTPEQSERILELLNTLKAQEFSSYGVTKGRVSKLIAWKNRHGPFQTIQDILMVDGFGLKVAEKFFQSMVKAPGNNSEGAENKQSRPRFVSFVTPSLDAAERVVIRSCVSLRIGVSSVTWSRLEIPEEELNEPCLLTHWHHHEISEKKLHLNDLVQRCLYVDNVIPQADCYVFENPQMAQIMANPGSVVQQNISLQKSQITAVLAFAVARRQVQADNEIEGIANAKEKTQHGKGPPKVYYLRRFLAARLFSHLVGSERVSSEDTVMNMMRVHFNILSKNDFITEQDDKSQTNNSQKSSSLESIRRNIEFPMELREMFANTERYQREFLGQALLLNLAFIRLVLLQDAQSIAAVTRQSNKDKLPQVLKGAN